MNNKMKRRGFKDYYFLISMIWKMKPQRILLEFLVDIIQQGQIIFYSVIFLKVIFSSIEDKLEYKYIIMFILISSVGYFVCLLFSNWYCEYYRPIWDIEVTNSFNNMVFEKAATSEIAIYENTDFYNNFTVAMIEVKDRVLMAINELCAIAASLCITIILCILVQSISTVSLSFIVIPIIATFVLGRITNKLRYHLYLDNVTDVRKKDYVKRMVYLNSSAKELRLYKIFNVLRGLLEESCTNIIRRYKCKGTQIALFRALYDNATTNLIYYGSIVYATILILVCKSISISSYLVLINAIIQFGQQMNTLLSKIINVENMKMYISNFVKFLEYEPQISEKQDGLSISESDMSIEFKDIYFSYSEGNKKSVLEDINISIKQGEKVAIVGANGSGKTTLIKLLLRFYDCTAGDILINGKNIKSYNVKKYRDKFATVLQDFAIFSMSIRDNILLGDKDSINEVESAIHKSRLDTIFQNKEINMDSILTREFDDNGIVLSGGQEQRLAVARAFVRTKKSKVLIFDESTSALDPIAEHDLYKKIFDECQGKTVIYISHRVSSAILADNIYVMDHGRIIEKGTHTQLMEGKTLYKKMYTIQKMGYTEGATE